MRSAFSTGPHPNINYLPCLKDFRRSLQPNYRLLGWLKSGVFQGNRSRQGLETRVRAAPRLYFPRIFIAQPRVLHAQLEFGAILGARTSAPRQGRGFMTTSFNSQTAMRVSKIKVRGVLAVLKEMFLTVGCFLARAISLLH